VLVDRCDAGLKHPRIAYTDLNGLRLLATFGEAVPLRLPEVYYLEAKVGKLTIQVHGGSRNASLSIARNDCP
jgi:hypothetical protein